MKLDSVKRTAIRRRYILFAFVLWGLFGTCVYMLQQRQSFMSYQEHEALAERVFDELEGELVQY